MGAQCGERLPSKAYGLRHICPSHFHGWQMSAHCYDGIAFSSSHPRTPAL
jgi:hypothetical protein